MSALLVALLLSAGANDTLAISKVGDLQMKLPTGWRSSSSDEGNGKSRSFDAGEAQLEISVFAVDPRRDGQVCLEQLLKALGSEGYEQMKIGGQPAARKVSTDFVGEGEAAKTDANKVTTVSYVGCNGSTKWIMSMTSKAIRATRFGPVTKRIIDSVIYSVK